MAISRFCLCLIITCCTGSCAQAWWDDWEVETFTRYRIDNFDNNNNGYVDATNDAALHMQVERLAIADEVEQRSTDLSIPLIARGVESVVDSIVPGREQDSANSSLISSAIHTSILSPSIPSGSRLWVSDSSNPSFDGAQRSSNKTFSQYRGLSLERVVQLSHSHELLSRPVWLSTVQFACGVGYNNDNDSLEWSIGRDAFYLRDTETEKAGPYVGLVAIADRNYWQFLAGGRVQYAWDRYFESVRMQIDRVDHGSMINGASHRTNYAETLLGEFQLQVRRSFSPNLDMRIGYSGYFLGPIGDVRRGLDFVPNQIVSPHATTNVIAGAAFAVLELRR